MISRDNRKCCCGLTILFLCTILTAAYARAEERGEGELKRKRRERNESARTTEPSWTFVARTTLPKDPAPRCVSRFKTQLSSCSTLS